MFFVLLSKSFNNSYKSFFSTLWPLVSYMIRTAQKYIKIFTLPKK